MHLLLQVNVNQICNPVYIKSAFDTPFDGAFDVPQDFLMA